MTGPGRLIGVGTGPGDPELLTLKAVKAIGVAEVIAYFAKRGRGGNGKAIVEHLIRPDAVLLPLFYPVTTEIEKNEAEYRRQITDFYEQSAEAVAAHLDAGRTVAVLSEGDPLFYGSYMHLHVRLANRYLQASGRLAEAVYVERGTMANAAMVKLADRPEGDAPYFSLVLVPGWESNR
jgi:precorrin-2/cobalt-factor-2 C20-methyltransferase